MLKILKQIWLAFSGIFIYRSPWDNKPPGTCTNYTCMDRVGVNCGGDKCVFHCQLWHRNMEWDYKHNAFIYVRHCQPLNKPVKKPSHLKLVH